MTETFPPFPLPSGHRYGANPYDLAVHDGSEYGNDAHWLSLWQREYSFYDRDLHVSGKFDGPTQRACIAVQVTCELTITSELDAPTWDALYSGRFKALRATLTPEQAPPVVRTTPYGRSDLGKLAGVVDTPKQKDSRAAARTAESNARKILWRHRKTGEAPEWYGLPEAGRQQRARSILGMDAVRGDLPTRLRGVQSAAQIPVTGDLDPATAWLLDEMLS